MTALRASKSASTWQQKIADLAARREVHAGAGEAVETVRRDARFPSLARVGLIC